jgi:hypothetical protein
VALQRLVLAISLAISLELTYEDIDEIELQLKLFVAWYYETFYQRDPSRLLVCKYTIHCLLHLVKNIRD